MFNLHIFQEQQFLNKCGEKTKLSSSYFKVGDCDSGLSSILLTAFIYDFVIVYLIYINTM